MRDKKRQEGERGNALISYSDDGTFVVLSDSDLADVLGGTGHGGVAAPLDNTGCGNSGCTIKPN